MQTKHGHLNACRRIKTVPGLGLGDDIKIKKAKLNERTVTQQQWM